MTCREDAVGDASWRRCPDPLAAAGRRLRALVRARMLDEVSGQPVAVGTVSTPDRRLALHLAPRLAGDGLVGLAGHPGRVFPALALDPGEVPLRVTAPGYLPLDLPGTLGPFPGFPDDFTPIDHGDVRMHRVGVALHGRVVRRGTPFNTPLPNAAVAITGLWSSFPPPGTSPALLMEPPRICALAPGFYADHAAATLEQCLLLPDAAAAKRLVLPAGPGTARLRLSDRGTLTAGQPLLIDPDDPDRRELIGLAAVDSNLAADQPAWVTLDYPLKYLHRPAARVLPAPLPLTQDPRTLARPALRGDPVALLGATAPWPDGAPVRVLDGPRPVEYQWAGRFATAADGDGYFRLPRLSRVALFQLRATHATEPLPLLLTVEPDYRRAEQDLQVAFE